jgi:hypothetical protein
LTAKTFCFPLLPNSLRSLHFPSWFWWALMRVLQDVFWVVVTWLRWPDRRRQSRNAVVISWVVPCLEGGLPVSLLLAEASVLVRQPARWPNWFRQLGAWPPRLSLAHP